MIDGRGILFIECDRTCIRAETVGELTAEQVAATRALLARTGAHWERRPERRRRV